VPGDVSVIGYDDDYSAAYAAPALTSVHIPTAELTQNAVRWLVNECYGTAWEIFREFPVTVTMRASVGAPRHRSRPLKRPQPNTSTGTRRSKA